MDPTQLGKYTLIEQLGKGGFGTVYKATDPIGRTVAIKVLKPGWVDDPGVIARFRLEALTAGELFHSRISTILDFDEVDNHPFLVMRYVDGQSLDKLLAVKGRLDWETAVRILKEVAEGLDFAHRRGFIHRDVKPANILISVKEGAVLTDFGLVKAAQVSGLSSSEVLLGSPPYIAPEVWEGKKASPATDIYALACVFYEMITGKILFSGDSSPQIMTQHVLEGPQFPSTWPEEIPLEVDGVLRKALIMEPGERYPSAMAFASALDELGHQQTLQQSEGKNAITPKPRQNVMPNRRPFVLWSLIGLFLLAFLAVSLILAIGSLRHRASRAIPTAESFTPTLTKLLATPTAVNTSSRTPLPTTNTQPLPSSTDVITFTPVQPTIIATLSLPALIGTAIPQPVIVISVENAKQVVQLARLGKGSAVQIAWSPDGSEIAIAHSLGIYFFNAQSLQQLRFIDMPVRVLSLAYSPDGKQLAIGKSDHTIQLLQVKDRSVSKTLVENVPLVRCLAFSGKYLVSGSDDGVVRVWQWEDSKLIQVLRGHQKSIFDVAISPNGFILASGSADNTIKLWDLETGSLLNTLNEHTDVVNEVAFSPDGRFLASASNDLTVRFWEIPDGKLLWVTPHQDYVYSVAFSPDGKIVATASRDKIIRLLNSDDGSLIRELPGHRSAVDKLIFSPDGKNLASIAEDGTMGLWQVEDGQILRLAEFATGLVRSVTFTTDSRFIAAGTRDGSVQFWDVVNGNEVNLRPMIHKSQVNSLFALPNNDKLVSGSEDNSVKIWSMDGKEIQDFSGSTSSIASVAVSSDGLLLAAGSYDGTVYIWQISDGLLIKSLKESDKPIWSLSFSPDNVLLAAASFDGWVRTWKTADWSNGFMVNLGEGVSVMSLAFSPDSKIIAIGFGDQGTIRLYRVSDGASLNILEGHKDQVWSMCFTPNGQVLVSGSKDATLRLWQVSDGSILKVLEGHLNSISNIACSQNGKLIASGSWDGTIRVWGIAP